MKQIEALKYGSHDRVPDLILACRLGRRWTVAAGDQRPTARKAPSFRAFLHTRKEQERQMPLLFFLAGAEGLEHQKGSAGNFYTHVLEWVLKAGNPYEYWRFQAFCPRLKTGPRAV